MTDAQLRLWWRFPYPTSGAAIDQWVASAYYCLDSRARARGREYGRYQWHRRPFDEHIDYCITPPVSPPITFSMLQGNTIHGAERPGLIGTVAKPRLCIVCGRVHVTSQDCPVPEPRETSGRDSMPRRHDGYTLQRARNMGIIDDEDNY